MVYLNFSSFNDLIPFKSQMSVSYIKISMQWWNIVTISSISAEIKLSYEKL